MELKGVLEPALKVRPDDSLSHVASRMIKGGVNEVFVWNGDFLGIVTADEIAKRSISNPDKVKISNFIHKITPFPADTPVADLINYVLVSDLKSVPVKHGEDVYMVRKQALLKFIKDDVFSGKKARNLMIFPYCISTDDSFSTAISIMRDFSLSRIPVLDSGSSVVGIVDSISLLKAVMSKKRLSRGEKGGEKISVRGISVSSVMKTDFMRVGPEEGVKKIVNSIQRKNIQTVVVEKNGKFMGIITPKDIFKLIGRSMETLYIRVSGLQEEDKFIQEKIDEMINNSIGKILKKTSVNYLAINVTKHRKGGERMKYSVHGRIETGKGSFHANDYEWDSTKAMKKFLGKIEREIENKLGRSSFRLRRK
ncbi:MAG: CBS domain-containing protein [Candidatus Aenigmarchaeota archaeon]|nr:CBS domain-containing protein [Candidatus Aenigmarchaeota archaeon]